MEIKRRIYRGRSIERKLSLGKKEYNDQDVVDPSPATGIGNIKKSLVRKMVVYCV